MCLNKTVTYVGESYRGKTFAHFGSFAKVGRPRGRNKKSQHTPKRRMNAEQDGG